MFKRNIITLKANNINNALKFNILQKEIIN